MFVFEDRELRAALAALDGALQPLQVGLEGGTGEKQLVWEVQHSHSEAMWELGRLPADLKQGDKLVVTAVRGDQGEGYVGLDDIVFEKIESKFPNLSIFVFVFFNPRKFDNCFLYLKSTFFLQFFTPIISFGPVPQACWTARRGLQT